MMMSASRLEVVSFRLVESYIYLYIYNLVLLLLLKESHKTKQKLEQIRTKSSVAIGALLILRKNPLYIDISFSQQNHAISTIDLIEAYTMINGKT